MRDAVEVFLRNRGRRQRPPSNRAGTIGRVTHAASVRRTHAGTAPASHLRWQTIRAALRTPRAVRVVKQADALGLMQDPGEIRALFLLVSRARPGRVLEIGNAHGGSLFLWTHAARPDARLMHVDRPPWEPDDPREREMRARLSGLARRSQTIDIHRNEACHPEAREAVEGWLAGARLDFLFLTRDGSDATTRTEYDLYAPLVRPGGLIAIQGIVAPAEGQRPNAAGFWRHVRADGDAVELVSRPPRPGFGIGMIRTR